MKLTYKLIIGFVTLASIMCVTSYLTILTFNDLKVKIVQLETDSIEEFKSSLKILNAIEGSEELIKTLIYNDPNIIYKFSQFSNTQDSTEDKIQMRESLIKDLKKIEKKYDLT